MSIFTVAWDRKMRGSAEDCDRVGVQFIPLAFESLGGWHKEAEKEVKKLAVAMARQSGKAESECCNQATTRLSLLLMRGNASILINRIPAPQMRWPHGMSKNFSSSAI